MEHSEKLDAANPAKGQPVLAGKVTRLEDFGLGFVKNEETNEQFAFTFDKIAGYRGERPDHLGLEVGADVTFHLSNGLVDSIQLGSIDPSKQ